MKNALRYLVVSPSGQLTATVSDLGLALMVAAYAGDKATVSTSTEPGVVLWTEGVDGEGASCDALEANLLLVASRSAELALEELVA